MQKLLHFDTSPEEYRAGACVVSCFDARFEPAIRKFLKRRGALPADRVKIAGAARWLASPEHEEDRAFVLRQIRTSMARHGAQRLLLFLHIAARTAASPRSATTARANSPPCARSSPRRKRSSAPASPRSRWSATSSISKECGRRREG